MTTPSPIPELSEQDSKNIDRVEADSYISATTSRTKEKSEKCFRIAPSKLQKITFVCLVTIALAAAGTFMFSATTFMALDNSLPSVKDMRVKTSTDLVDVTIEPRNIEGNIARGPQDFPGSLISTHAQSFLLIAGFSDFQFEAIRIPIGVYALDVLKATDPSLTMDHLAVTYTVVNVTLTITITSRLQQYLTNGQNLESAGMVLIQEDGTPVFVNLTGSIQALAQPQYEEMSLQIFPGQYFTLEAVDAHVGLYVFLHLTDRITDMIKIAKIVTVGTFLTLMVTVPATAFLLYINGRKTFRTQ